MRSTSKIIQSPKKCGAGRVLFCLFVSNRIKYILIQNIQAHLLAPFLPSSDELEEESESEEEPEPDSEELLSSDEVSSSADVTSSSLSSSLSVPRPQNLEACK